MIRRLREDREFYRNAYDSVTYFRDLIDMIRDPSGVRVHQMAYYLWRGAHDGLDALVNRGGIMGVHGFSYWHAGLEASLAPLCASTKGAGLGQGHRDGQGALGSPGGGLLRRGTVGRRPCPDLRAQRRQPGHRQHARATTRATRDMYALDPAAHPMMKGRTEGVGGRARNWRGARSMSTAHTWARPTTSARRTARCSATSEQLKQAGHRRRLQGRRG